MLHPLVTEHWSDAAVYRCSEGSRQCNIDSPRPYRHRREQSQCVFTDDFTYLCHRRVSNIVSYSPSCRVFSYHRTSRELCAVSSLQDDGWTSLHVACFYGHDIVVSTLLKHDAVDIDRLTVQITCMRCGDTMLRMRLASGWNAASAVLLLHL